MTSDWNIREPANRCELCRREFQDRESLYSKLEFGEAGYVRADYCLTCWPSVPREAALSVWKSSYRAPEPPPPEPIRRETAESLLRQLMETEDPSRKNVIFILAVILERRRILVERRVSYRKDGVKIRIYEHRKTGETFIIPDPCLRLDELETVQQEVTALLGAPMTTPASKDDSSSPDNQQG